MKSSKNQKSKNKLKTHKKSKIAVEEKRNKKGTHHDGKEPKEKIDKKKEEKKGRSNGEEEEREIFICNISVLFLCVQGIIEYILSF